MVLWKWALFLENGAHEEIRNFFHFRAFGISNEDQRNLAKDMKIVEKRCRAKSKKYNNSDRLLIDKDYLSTLSKVVFTFCIACSPNTATNFEISKKNLTNQIVFNEKTKTNEWIKPVKSSWKFEFVVSKSVSRRVLKFIWNTLWVISY